MKSSRRPKRVAFQIQQEICAMIARNLKDRRIGMVTVTGVDVSPDLKHAKVWVTAMGTAKQQKDSVSALNHASGWIRSELGQRVRMKFVPELVFKTDTSQEYGQHIDELLKQIQE